MVSEDTDKPSGPKRSYGEVFEEYCPYFMSLGMSYEQYWYGDNQLPRYYAKAEELRKDRIDAEMHTQAMYIYEAICDATPLMRPFAKAGTKAVPFRTKTYRQEMWERKHPEEMEKRKAETMFAKVQAWAANTRRIFGVKAAKKEVSEHGGSG